mgnify:CR=1 FL=1
MRGLFKKICNVKVAGWIAGPLIFLTFFWFFTSQERGMAQAENHVAAIQSAWEAEQIRNSRLRGMKFCMGTADDGCILIIGTAISEEDYQVALNFLKQTDPPRAIRRIVTIVGEGNDIIIHSE